MFLIIGNNKIGETMNENDLILLNDINISLKKSKQNLLLVKKYIPLENEMFNYQLKIYNKYISLTKDLLEKEKYKKTANKDLIDITFLKATIYSLFKIDNRFYFTLLEKEISNNMRRVILSEGKYSSASKDIQFLTKYYLSIETRIILKLNELCK